MKPVLLIAIALVTAVACSPPRSEQVIGVRPMEAQSPVAQGDCAEAVRRAVAEPDLDVDSLPRPVTQRPPPFARMPWAVKQKIDAEGSSVKVEVLVDTLGRPVMKTFTVVESSHPWLAANLKSAMPSWRFRAARLSGCKVPRVWKFSATSQARG